MNENGAEVGLLADDIEGRRYLSPEPLLQDPTWVASQLRSGRQVPAYGYALNNPVTVVDPNGKNPLLLLLCAGGGCEAAAAGALAATTYVLAGATAAVAGAYCGATGNCFGNPTVPVSALPNSPDSPNYRPYLEHPVLPWADTPQPFCEASSRSKAEKREAKCEEHCIAKTTRFLGGDPYWKCRSCCLGRIISPECNEWGPYPE